MNSNIRLFIIIVLTISLSLIFSCKKLDFSRVTKLKISNIELIENNSVNVFIDIFDLSNKNKEALGICYSNANIEPTIDNQFIIIGMIDTMGMYSYLISDLNPNEKYYFRAFIREENEIIYSFNVSDLTIYTYSIPEITTKSVSNIKKTSAKSGGIINFNGGLNITESGVCWNTEPIPTIYHNKTENTTESMEFDSDITSLSPNTTYYVRAYAINSIGISYGEEVSFTTVSDVFYCPQTIDDIDGNAYNTIVIDGKCIMKENLKVTKYSDNTSISFPNENNIIWQNSGSMQIGAYAWYDNNLANKDIYGALYNWYAVNSEKLCPIGWHVTTDDEWNSIIESLGGSTIAGGKLKETGLDYWQSPNPADNSTGFSARPAGYRNYNGNFSDIGRFAYFWTEKEYSPSISYHYKLAYNYTNTYRNSDKGKGGGFSVRCVKDWE